MSDLFIGELITLSIMAFALGMDAFSVGLGMGMVKLRKKQIFYIGFIIGLFHVIMPLAGMAAGNMLSGAPRRVSGLYRWGAAFCSWGSNAYGLF